MPGSVRLGDPIIINARNQQYAGLVTGVLAVKAKTLGEVLPDNGQITSERISAVAFPPNGQSFNLPDIERDDLLDRKGPLARASSWQHREAE